MFIQQGDVLIKQIDFIPKGKKLNHLILAKGEATGHAHVITKGDAEIIELNDQWYLKVLSDEAIVTHEEHKAVKVPMGEYRIDIVREYDHFEEEARRVAD